MMHYDIIIIGAGPAGLFTAISAPQDRKILILEKQQNPALKLLISGNGQANLTHTGSVSDFLSRYGKEGKRFVKHSLFSFSNQDLLNFFGERGVKFISDKNGKQFPTSRNAGELLSVLLSEIEARKIELRLDSPVNKIEKEDGVFKITTKESVFTAEKLVIATGGKSYPSTGSSGDGQQFAHSLGHTITQMKPALTSVFINSYPFSELSGVSFSSITSQLWRNSKKLHSFVGEMLLTHKGLSGPVILDNSRYMQKGDTLTLNFCGIKSDNLLSLVLQTAQTDPKMTLKIFLKRYNIPKRLQEKLMLFSGIDSTKNIAELSKKKIAALATILTAFPCEISSLDGFEHAMVTTGGVSTTEINSKTMQSKLLENLYFAGEVIDIDGDSGGFNLQFAFSSGFIVGSNL